MQLFCKMRSILMFIQKKKRSETERLKYNRKINYLRFEKGFPFFIALILFKIEALP